MIEKIKQASLYLKDKTQDFQPEIGVILGTGLGGLINEVEVKYSINYDEIPNFPISTVESHHGKLIFGVLSGKKVVVMQGRFHYYEGYSMQEVTFPVRVLKLLGIQKLFVSNAAGGLNPSYQKSDIMIIKDHIDLLPDNPLRGKNLDEFGDRFPDMLDAYEPSFRQKALTIAKEKNIAIQEGVYASVSGPNLETPAEYKYLQIIGADAIGMSTVPEVIVARHMSLPVFAASVITDLCYEGQIKKVTLQEVIDAAQKAEKSLIVLIKELITVL